MMSTEGLNPLSTDIDILSVQEILLIMNGENIRVLEAIHASIGAISRAVQDAVETIRSGRRLFYIGAGSSGRLGVLDASEIPPTFGVDPEMVRAIIAGGERALDTAVEGAEDDEESGFRAASMTGEGDMLLGISASGTTPFTLSALREGKRRGARCWLLTCNDVTYDFLEGIIVLDVGPEIIAGSTRLKAGTATKIVLNMISTASMIKLGKVYKGYMVDVVPSNKKLRRRAIDMIQEITGCGIKEAESFLEKSGGNAKIAIVMYKKGLDLEEAKDLLKRSGGFLRMALGNM